MKHYKKIILSVISVIMVIFLTACATSNSTSTATGELILPEDAVVSSGIDEKVTAAADIELNYSDYEDNLDGLIKYLKDAYAIAGEQTEMSYDVISAVAGYKFAFKFNGGTAQVELYEFDLDNISDEVKSNLENVKNNGKLQVLENEIDATISDNGKYVMLYTDSSSEDKNNTQKNRVIDLFKGFYAE